MIADKGAPHPLYRGAGRDSRMTKTTKFLLMSNMRSGSTWLITTLGTLPDTVTEYEVKWKVDYQPQPIHCVLDENSPTVSEIFDGFDQQAPIIGSKFVFDLVDLSRAEFMKLRDKLRGDLRIIHLVRRYRDVFLSRHRGFFHQLNETASWRISDHLRGAIEAARPRKLEEPNEPGLVSRAQCYEELKIYLQNDVWASLVREIGVPYLLVSYERLHERLADIVKFIGSEATPELISQLVKTSVTVKLPQVPAEQTVGNIAELDALFEHFEQMRLYLLGEEIAAEYDEPSSVMPPAARSVPGPKPKARDRLRWLRLR
jgi:LPS sulfotransferase NodH